MASILSSIEYVTREEKKIASNEEKQGEQQNNNIKFVHQYTKYKYNTTELFWRKQYPFYGIGSTALRLKSSDYLRGTVSF